MKQILITGDRSGSGKTSITLALAALLSKEHIVQTFKVGMDYIDPSYLSAVSGRPCRNLDSFTLSGSQIRDIFRYGCRGADMAIVEGVRGLYEGAEALTDTGSTAAIAKTLHLPVILVVSAQSITRSSAAIVKGFQAFDPKIRFAGVILNNVRGGSHTAKATTAIEHYCGIPVIGAIPRMEEMQLSMRHLGLVPWREGSGQGDFDDRIGTITEMIGQYVDLDRFVSLMKEDSMPQKKSPVFDTFPDRDVRIGIALDEAFNFYYADLFDILHTLGAEYIPFSPVHDRLPEADGYIFGGGYPELFISQLEANDRMREAVKETAKNGVPIYAECGGLMYLTERMTLRKGWQGSAADQCAGMCGIFTGETRMPARRVVSYVEGISEAASPVGRASFRGHEFHYSDVSLNKDTRFAYRLSRGVGIRDNRDGAVVNNTLGSYTHLHPVAGAGMFRHFIGLCREIR
ncbi:MULTISPECIES: Ni-sirohydrochlorin a,c-diamide synthase [unclassified Methanoregula]|uniref:Ni-sirohydrochlorin a,c-diamide synthase n=1 Tax=unclassified Methanoregula TaxID=2649730 RepID=UPI0009CFA772|nr:MULTISPECIES: Ni-sirohydrochlorin a,c-diamide synthase [unclassified Methanoregula]OPX65400.1 MAG: cobyrinic acid a,c-diamide synthase [Methanoregula sp. PtaB.Bin085]OPY32309.1 MAG: cobyrinic acid a,c-diamide synthase [Methanoregula sp. PtaU1.Bin006]